MRPSEWAKRLDRLVSRAACMRGLLTLAPWSGSRSAYRLCLQSPTQGGGRRNLARAKHRAEIRDLPDELYPRDRCRAIRGNVMDADGKPISGAIVRCVIVESLVEPARPGGPAAAKWAIPIDAETKSAPTAPARSCTHRPARGRFSTLRREARWGRGSSARGHAALAVPPPSPRSFAAAALDAGVVGCDAQTAAHRPSDVRRGMAFVRPVLRTYRQDGDPVEPVVRANNSTNALGCQCAGV
jgi:hypothetical protein